MTPCNFPGITVKVASVRSVTSASFELAIEWESVPFKSLDDIELAQL